MAMLNNQMVYSFGHHPNSIMKVAETTGRWTLEILEIPEKLAAGNGRRHKL